MSTAVPAAGEASAATAPAAATDPGPQSTALRTVTPPPAVPRCDNCGANVPGRFCGTCGQRLEPPVHTLWHFMQVAAEDVTHADSRLWRTLAALLFKPGFLTREFLAGHRARYLPPVRLYLVLSVVFFVWLAATSHTEDEAHLSPETRAAIAEARQHGAIVIAPGAAAAGATTGAVSGATTGATPATAAPRAAFSGSALEGDEQHCKLIHYHGPWQATLQPLFVRSCSQAAQDHGRSLAQSFLHNLPRAMFLFLPLLAGVMMLLYWHPRHYYVEHLLFCLHNHAFAFLVLLLAGILSALLPFAAMLIGWVTTLYVAWYLYRSMRVMYGQGRLRTVAKLGGLAFVYLVAGSLTLAATALYAFVTL
ncbi:MAG: DUF3667 domain-containing protein [Steroidobacteraceae bacterium]